MSLCHKTIDVLLYWPQETSGGKMAIISTSDIHCQANFQPHTCELRGFSFNFDHYLHWKLSFNVSKTMNEHIWRMYYLKKSVT